MTKPFSCTSALWSAGPSSSCTISSGTKSLCVTASFTFSDRCRWSGFPVSWIAWRSKPPIEMTTPPYFSATIAVCVRRPEPGGP